jgi:molecular chaperone GrpE
VEEVPVGVGDSFDAMNAEALTTTSQPTLPDGAVAAVYERGYMLRDMLLRPARVIVNHHPHEGNPDAEGSRE